jgi:ankyrin repeat protein
VIQLLLETYPMALKQKDKDGRYPLHLACKHKQWEAVIKFLVDKYPVAIQREGKRGYYPLEWALL